MHVRVVAIEAFPSVGDDSRDKAQDTCKGKEKERDEERLRADKESHDDR